MRTEIRCAVEFLSQLMTTSELPFQFIEPFRQRLEQLLVQRFRGHWHQEKPLKGSAYRCIRINEQMDPLITEAAKVTGLADVAKYLPKELTMWIDPKDVSYRFGEDGSISQLPLDSYQKKVTVTQGFSNLAHVSHVYNLPEYTNVLNHYYKSTRHANSEISVRAS